MTSISRKKSRMRGYQSLHVLSLLHLGTIWRYLKFFLYLPAHEKIGDLVILRSCGNGDLAIFYVGNLVIST